MNRLRVNRLDAQSSRTLTPRRFVLLLAVLASITTMAVTTLAGTRRDVRAEGPDDDAHWRPGFHVMGADSWVRAIVQWDSSVVAGGYFDGIGSASVPRIASWNGHTWSPLGGGIDGRVYALTVFDGHLVAAGDFTSAGGVPARGIAAWDGHSWRALGAGFDGNVFALTVFNGRLIAGGDFSHAEGRVAAGIAAWDGVEWSPLGGGTGGQFPVVRAFATYAGELYAGGDFTTAGDVSARYLARWNGTAWNALSGRPTGAVWALAVFRGELIAGGVFDSAGGVQANRVVAWNGSTWHGLGGGIEYRDRFPLVMALASTDEFLYVGGNFNWVGGVPASSLAAWDGDSWNTLSGGVSIPEFYHRTPEVRTLLVANGLLYTGGIFQAAGPERVYSAAVWDGTVWHAMEPGLGLAEQQVVLVLATFRQRLLAAGDFKYAGNSEANRVAVLGDSGWTALGSGVDGAVYAALERGDELIVGGSFTHAGGIAADRVARWTGAEWQPLGAGFDGPVLALATFRDTLIAAGAFQRSGGVPVGRIAKWTGTNWLQLGPGMDEQVRSLVVHDGALIAGGYFRTVGAEEIHGVAAWDGTQWSALGSGLQGGANALGNYGARLIAAGAFDAAGGVPARNVASWDGRTWSPLARGVVHAIYAVETIGTHLFVGGDWCQCGGTYSANGVSGWDGSRWYPIGSGVNSEVNSLHALDGSLFIGGQFSRAGRTRSNGLAQWDAWTVAIALTDLGAARRGDRVVVSARIEGADVALLGVRIQRASDVAGPFFEIGVADIHGSGFFEFEDSTAAADSEYWYLADVYLAGGSSIRGGPVRVVAEAVGLETALFPVFDRGPQLPIEVRFAVARPGGVVNLAVYDVRGRLVRELEQTHQDPGIHVVHWDRRSGTGAPAKRGVYFVRLRTPNKQFSRKLIVGG